jgi:hypothetical protein
MRHRHLGRRGDGRIHGGDRVADVVAEQMRGALKVGQAVGGSAGDGCSRPNQDVSLEISVG